MTSGPGKSTAPRRGRWRLHGLNVKSDLPLPCPPAEGKGTDLTIRWLGPVSRVSPVPKSFGRTWEREGGGWLLRYLNRDGSHLAIHLEPDGSALSLGHDSPFDWRDFLTILLGPAMAAVLRLRGTPVLHGGAVVIGGGAALFLSGSGAGKSTITAALVDSGQPLLSDEVIALSFEDDGVNAQPGHSFLKLSSRAVAGLGKSLDPLPLVSPGFIQPEERWLDARSLKGGLAGAPAPLRAVYILSGRIKGLREPRIVPLTPAAASIALGRHFYGRPWLSPAPVEAMRLGARIAGAARVRQVWLPDGLDAVRDAARALAADALSGPGAAGAA